MIRCPRGIRPVLSTNARTAWGIRLGRKHGKGRLGLRAWLAKTAATLVSYGPWGLAAAAFLDSGFLPLPEFVDFYVMMLCIANPHAMALYAGVTTLGSVAGCLVLFYLARLGGHGFAERKVGKQRMERLRSRFERYELLTIMVPALLPPPVPFKAFVITAGVVDVHLGKFLLALVVGRAIRFFGEAFLAVRYGPAVIHFLRAHGPLLTAVLGVVLLAAWLIVRRVRGRKRGVAASAEDSAG